MSKSKSFRDVMLPMRAVKWIIGCGDIIEYPLGKPQEKISFFYSLAWVLSYCLVLYVSTYYDSLIQESQENVVEHISKSGTFFYLFLVSQTIFLCWKNGKKVSEIFKGIEKVDKLLRKLKISDEYAKMYKKQICLMAFIATISTVIVIITYYICPLPNGPYVFAGKVAVLLKYLYPRIIMFVQDFTFISYTMCLNKKFVQLNEALQAMSGTSCLYPQYMKVFNSKTHINERESSKLGKKTNDDVEILKIAKKAHLALVKISQHINGIFGFHLLVSMIDSSVTIVFYTYGAYGISITVERPSDIVIPVFFVCLTYVIRIFAVNYICEKTTNEARKTGRIICELHEPATKQQFRSEIRDFTLQLVQDPLQFIAFGFATLNHSLILDIAASAATYLVILFQLRDMGYHE